MSPPRIPVHHRPTLLIVGCGDVGLRVVRLLKDRWRLLALTSNPDRRNELRRAGAVPLSGDLDLPATLARLAWLADAVLHLAPPAPHDSTDLRTRNLLRVLARSRRVRCIVYGSTSGVYGDAKGARVAETRRVAPSTDRARRRIDAEQQLRDHGRRFGVRVSLLRIPGIYAPDRVGGHPRERLAQGKPVLCTAEDVYTSHIHADDLARACVAALWKGLPQRAVNVCDDTEMLMGDYFDLAADLSGMSRPPRVERSVMARQVSPMALSFMNESRRLVNTRMKRELGLRLRYPTVREGL